MAAAVLSKSAYAAHRSVSAACVTNWITRRKLTAPALLPDGKIDVALADKQVLVIARRSPPRPRRRPAIRRDDDADVHPVEGRGRPPPGDRHEEPIGAFVVVDELPGLAQRLRLDRGQVAALSRWFLGRRAADAIR
jgi:hypothetical protein